MHDYHLIPLARELRRLGVDQPDRLLPAHSLAGAAAAHHPAQAPRSWSKPLFAYDLVGFQTDEWLWAFESYVLGEAGGRWATDGRLRGLRPHACGPASFPIGLDAEEFAALAASPAAHRAYDRMAAAQRVPLPDRRASTGWTIPRAWKSGCWASSGSWRTTPTCAARCSTCRSRRPRASEVEAYQDLRARIDALSGRINGAYADMDWAPIRYVHRNYRRDELAGVYRAARVGLVTPLRDGMNLVAKEYVAAQNPDDPGRADPVALRRRGAADDRGA